MREVIHLCPPDNAGVPVAPCCRCHPVDLPATDRFTFEVSEVTCPAPILAYPDCVSDVGLSP